MCSGNRLPDPDYCPTSILRLLKQCFKEDPDIRPDFEKVKIELQVAYESMVQISNSSRKTNGNKCNQGYSMPLHKVNNTMESQYATIIKQNQEYEKRRNRGRQEQAVIEAESHKYASIQNLMIIGTNEATFESDEMECKPKVTCLQGPKLMKVDQISSLLSQTSNKLERSCSYQEESPEEKMQLVKTSISETKISETA